MVWAVALLTASSVLPSATAADSDRAGATDCFDSDPHDPETVLREAARTRGLRRPVALMFMQVSGHIADYTEARSIVDTLMAALPSGSYVVFNDSVGANAANAVATRQYNESGAVPYYLRSPAELAGSSDGLEPSAPGVVR